MPAGEQESDAAVTVSTPDFSVEARPDTTHGITTIVVTGEVDVATAPLLRNELHRVIAAGATRLRIDLTDVVFIDSAGLGVLIGALKRVRERAGEIELHGLQPAPRRVVEITGLDELFAIND